MTIVPCGKGGCLHMKTTNNISREASVSRMKLLLILISGMLITASCGGSYGGSGSSMASAPGVFSLSMPANAAMSVSITPQLTWTASPNATSYEVQINTMNTFSAGTMVNDTKNLTTTTYTVSPALSSGTMYFWRVIASSAYGTYTAGPFSFTTM